MTDYDDEVFNDHKNKVRRLLSRFNREPENIKMLLEEAEKRGIYKKTSVVRQQRNLIPLRKEPKTRVQTHRNLGRNSKVTKKSKNLFKKGDKAKIEISKVSPESESGLSEFRRQSNVIGGNFAAIVRDPRTSRSK